MAKSKPKYKKCVVRKYKTGSIIEYWVTDMDSGLLVRRQKRVEKQPNPMLEQMWIMNYIRKVNTALEQGYQYRNVPKQVNPKQYRLIDAITEQVRLFNPTIRKDTARTFTNFQNVFLDFLNKKGLNHLLLHQFDKTHIQQFIGYLIETRGNTNLSVNNRISQMKTVFNKLIERGVLVESPVKGIRPLREDQPDMNIPFTDEAKQVLNEYMQVHDKQLYYFTQFMYYAFIRRTELMKLQIKHIDLKERIFRLSGSMTKNRKSETVEIYEPLYQIILEMNLDKYDSECYVFGSTRMPNKVPYQKADTFTDRFKLVLTKTNLRINGWSIYTFKDSGIVAAYKAGMDIRKLQMMVRHHSLEMLEIYLRSQGLRGANSDLSMKW
jgi:site-specific recombinase XerD